MMLLSEEILGTLTELSTPRVVLLWILKSMPKVLLAGITFYINFCLVVVVVGS